MTGALACLLREPPPPKATAMRTGSSGGIAVWVPLGKPWPRAVKVGCEVVVVITTPSTVRVTVRTCSGRGVTGGASTVVKMTGGV